MDTDVMYAAPAPSQTKVAPPAEDLTRADLAPEELAAEDLAAEDLAAEDLIEEVSIDGMCGVY
jgi:mycofactocin precursor